MRRAAATLLLAAVVSGCWLTTPESFQAAKTATDACLADDGQPLLDLRDAFWLCMPGNWRDLRPDDVGWVIVYGEEDSDVEQQVASGSMDHFAVPLKPRDADTGVNLAVYLNRGVKEDALQAIGEAYRSQINDRGSTSVTMTDGELPGGPAIEITSFRERDGGGSDWYDTFIFVSGDTGYYFPFGCSERFKDHYAPIFREMAESVGFPD